MPYMMAKDEAAYKRAGAELEDQLDGLEVAMTQTPWFNGDDFSMVDIAAAPIAVRLAITKAITGVDVLEDCPSLQAWFARLLERETVQASYVADLKDLLSELMEKNSSYVLGA